MKKDNKKIKNQIIKVLKTIPDPELGISIYDLGLIYDIKIQKDTVVILMTLTSAGCPLFDMMAVPIQDKIQRIPGVRKVEIELTFEPVWTIEKMNPKARKKLGF
jgi:metal-sulfur cluster biosynthetic enzyme